MANSWNIPDELEEKVRQRDKLCVYCRVEMKVHRHAKGTPRDKATFEHIDNDEFNISEGNITLCCAACNSSKGAKRLVDWLESEYCKEKNISKETVAKVIQEYLAVEGRSVGISVQKTPDLV